MIPTRRRRRTSGAIPVTVNVAPSGGVWTVSPTAGTLSALTGRLDTAPTEDPVRLLVNVDGLADAMILNILPGNATATLEDTSAVISSAVVSIANIDGGAFTVSGSITHTATTGGAVTLYNLLPRSI